MNLYWVYALPTWLFGILTIAIFVVTGVGGMFATRKWARGLHFEDRSHNDVVGFFLAAITVSYGVTLGLMSVGAWTTHTDAEMKVELAAIDNPFRGDMGVRPDAFVIVYEQLMKPGE